MKYKNLWFSHIWHKAGFSSLEINKWKWSLKLKNLCSFRWQERSWFTVRLTVKYGWILLNFHSWEASKCRNLLNSQFHCQISSKMKLYFILLSFQAVSANQAIKDFLGRLFTAESLENYTFNVTLVNGDSNWARIQYYPLGIFPILISTQSGGTLFILVLVIF